MTSLLKRSVLTLWTIGVGTGFGLAWRYEGTPGSAPPPSDWPKASALSLDGARPTVVQFVHPECPCSRVGLEEIAEAARRFPDRAKLVFVLVGAPGLDYDLGDSENARLAQRIVNAEVFLDPQGKEARRFGARTSGQTFAFSPSGATLFRGGVTVARGHYGDSKGLQALNAIFQGHRVGPVSTPVYGCALNAEVRR